MAEDEGMVEAEEEEEEEAIMAVVEVDTVDLEIQVGSGNRSLWWETWRPSIRTLSVPITCLC